MTGATVIQFECSSEFLTDLLTEVIRAGAREWPGVAVGSVKYLSRFLFSRDVGSLGLIRKQRSHVHIFAGGPLCSRDVPQSGRGRIKAGLPIGERSDNPGTTSDLPHDALQGVTGSKPDPMTVGEAVVGQGPVAVFFQRFRGFHRFHRTRTGDDGPHLPGRRLPVLPGVDRLRHPGYVPDSTRRHRTEDITVEMDGAALPPGVRREFRDAFHQPSTGIGNDGLNARKSLSHKSLI